MKRLLPLLAILFVATVAVADDDVAPRTENITGFPPLAVPAEALNHPDEEFARLSRKIADGSASYIERRNWYAMRKVYFPFTADALPPRFRGSVMRATPTVAKRNDDERASRFNFAQMLTRAGKMHKPLLPVVTGTPASYTWTHLGPTDYCVGSSNSPPAAGCPDKGTGRATAIWVNPNNKNEILLGFADGGLWKTTDQGTSWTPLFDFQSTTAIGSVTAVVPSGSLDGTATIWAATGEGNFGGDGVEGYGVAKSTDGGTTWTMVTVPWVVASDGTSEAPDRASIRRIAVDPNNSSKLWIAADSGLFRSTDGGTTWSLVTSAMYFKKYNDCWFVYWTDVIIDPSTNPSTVYAANGRISTAGCSAISREDNAVYRSTDDGATWTNISTANANCAGTVAGTTARGYTCIGTGFAASGLATSTTANGNVGRITLATSASNRKMIYALVNDVSTNQNMGVWVTNDASTSGSVTWRQAGTNSPAWASQAWYALSGAVDPTNTSRLIVGGLDAYVAAVPASGTATFNKTSDWTGVGTTTYAHADHHQLVYVDATTVYLATDGGLYIGTLTGTFGNANCFTWSGPNRGGIDTLQFYGIGQSPSSLYLIHGGLQDNGEAQSQLTGSAITGWTEAANGDGGMSATDQTTPANTYEEYVYAIMAKSTNSGATYGSCFRKFGTCTTFLNTCSGNCIPDNATEFIAPMTLDANNQTVLYSGSRYIYRNSPAGSTTWSGAYSPDLTTTNNANDIVYIHSAKNNGTSGTLWAGTVNGLVWMTTGATSATVPTWTNRSTATLPARSVTWIDTDPANGQKALVTYSGFNTGHIFRTTDGGTTWTDISGALPNEPFETIAVNPTNSAEAFAGSNYGVYVNHDVWNGNTWTKINNTQLPNVEVHQLQFTTAATGMLRAATHGRGFWETCTIATAAPTAVVAAAAQTNGQINLTWTGSGASKYRVYRSTTSGGPYTLITTVSTTSYSDTGLSQNTTYFYVVRGYDCAESANSNEAFATAACDAVPGSPGTPTFTTPAGSCAITLTWTAAPASSCGGAITYDIYRAVGALTPSASTLIASGISALTYTDTAGLVSGTTYTYLVRAYDSVSKKESTNATTATKAPTAGCTTSVGDLLVISVRSTATSNKIEFVGPASGAGLMLKLCYSTTAYPTSPSTCTAATPAFAINANGKASFTHTGLTNGTTYYYTAYVQNSGGTVFSAGRNIKAMPFDNTTGNIKWTFATTAATLSPPGVGSAYTSGNDRVLHSMNAGPTGGDWPSSWTPYLLNAPSQARPPIPSLPGLGSGKQAYLGTQDGNVYCIDANNGTKIWSTPAAIGAIVQGAANGIYTAYGGAYDLTLVGTRNATADNVFYGINALTGATAWTFNNGGGANGIGIINSDAYIDYATNRVYFTTRASSSGSKSTVWCLSFTNTTATKVWSAATGDVDGSPILWNNVLYVGNNSGTVYALNPSTGATLWSYATSDGPVKGFVNPDWTGASALYFATTNNVWAINDNDTSASLLWKQTITAPSIPLFVGSYVLVGSGASRLYQISNPSTATPAVTSIILGSGTVGSPSFDSDYNLAYVGNDAGVIYAVQLPLP